MCALPIYIGVATCDDPDIAMKLQRPLAELAHLSQHGEATLCLCGRRQLAQRFQAEPHGQRIRIEAVVDQREPLQPHGPEPALDRKSGVEGKSVAVRVESGGGRIIKKKKKDK